MQAVLHDILKAIVKYCFGRFVHTSLSTAVGVSMHCLLFRFRPASNVRFSSLLCLAWRVFVRVFPMQQIHLTSDDSNALFVLQGLPALPFSMLCSALLGLAFFAYRFAQSVRPFPARWAMGRPLSVVEAMSVLMHNNTETMSRTRRVVVPTVFYTVHCKVRSQNIVNRNISIPAHLPMLRETDP